MKYTIDDDAKTISVEGSPSLFKVVETLQKRFPNEEWKEYSLVSYNNTLLVDPYPWNPWQVTYCDSAPNKVTVN